VLKRREETVDGTEEASRREEGSSEYTPRLAIRRPDGAALSIAYDSPANSFVAHLDLSPDGKTMMWKIFNDWARCRAEAIFEVAASLRRG
jgi:hypothetical protein